MTDDLLKEEVERAQRQVRALLQGENSSKEELALGLEELSATLEDLHRSAEEARRKGEELVSSNRALRRSMERYRCLVENVDGVIYVVETSGKIAYISPAVERILGYSADEIQGENVFRFLHPEDSKLLEARLKSALGGSSRVSELRFIGKDGRVRHVRTYGRPIEGGWLRGIHGILVDATEQKKAEEALHESEERLKLAVDGADLAIWNRDLSTGEVVGNRRYAEMIGSSSADESDLQAWKSSIHPDDLPAVEAALREISAGRTNLFDLDYRTTSAPAETWVHDRGLVVGRDEAGRPIKMAGVMQDVTWQKKMDQAILEASEKQKELERIVNRSPAIAFVQSIPLGGPVEFVSENVSQLGYTPEDFYSGAVSFDRNLVHPEDLELVVSELKRQIEDGSYGFYQEFRVLTLSGEVRWVASNVWIIRDEDGAVTHVEGIALDITDRKKMEIELAESERRFREMADTLPQPIFECDLAGKVTFANQTAFELYGYDRQDLEVGVNIFQVFAYEDREEMMKNFQRSLNDDRVFTYEYTGLRKEGTTFHLIVYSRPIIRDGRPIGLRGTIVDITERKRVEENIKQLADLSEKLVEIGSPMIFVIDRDRRIFLWNRAAEMASGYSAQEVMGDEEVWTLLFPDGEERSEFLKTLDEIEMGLTAEGHRTRMMAKSGEEKVISWSGIKLEDGEGEGIGIVITAQDTTEYAKMEEEIRSEREFSRGIIEGADLLIVGLDPRGRITLFNRGAEKVTGRSAKEAFDENFFDRFIAGDDRMGFEIAVSSIFEGKAPEQTEAAVVTRTGDPMAIQWGWGVIRSRTGEIERVIAFGHDISYDRWLEEQMLLFMDAIESSNDGIAIFGKSNHLLFANPALLDMFGFRLEEARGRLHQDFILDFGEEAAPGGEGNGGRRRVTCVRKDGSTFPASISFAPVDSRDGKPMATIVVVRDISETIDYQQRLETLNRELESFAYTISHDLRAPLRGIRGFALALQEDYGDGLDEVGRRYIERIGTIAENMDRLILDLLDYSRIGRIRSPPEMVDLKKLVVEAYEDVKSTAKEKPANLTLAGEFPTISCEKSRAKQVFSNLLENSLKYSKDRIEIEVGCLDRGDEYEFWVRDNGLGFDMKYADRIFDPFTRLERSGEGSGIGLATVKKIVETCGGRIWAESSPGKGSIFRFTMPRREDPA
ncbi:MAG: PAS domain S-box protein [Methanothrix sp.]|nr:PAS domain S-box protein [Methanothrix sp.]NLX39502.1 PAS domain S-box protein [Methanothrix sp.]HPY72230.1 PAS domain S-box protein [Methanothrix sp.]HQA62736.1 PAS domain S-box protein [Methanothrix sp.]